MLRDRYEILSTLGEGGFGTVLKARQLATGQPVAIKVLRLSDGRPVSEREKRVTRFQREMQLCAQLQHPNIVRLIDSGHAERDIVYTVFEFAPGKDLAQLIADSGRLDPQETKHLMLQVLDALACAHAQGVVHRDLKPANLMIIPTGARRNALVLDFGIGALTDDARREDLARITMTNESVGTPSYAAPEQLRGLPPTPRSDLYAWGLVFLECLTGKRVVDGDTVAEVVFKQVSPEPIPIPASIADHPIGSILRRATVKDHAVRDVTAESLLHDLEACDVTGLRPRTGPTRLQPSASDAATATVEIASARGAPSQRLVEGERRQITAVCCTLSASGAGAKPVDPEELDQILGLQQEACVGVARRFGGHVAGALGDTLLFYFGYPTAREDDARRAARAALTLAAEMRARGAALSAERGVTISLRTGIHTGLVIARELRDPTISGLGYVVGTTPKVASRLSSLADPGAILLSGETRRLLRKEFLIEKAARWPAETGEPPLESYVLHEGSPASGMDDVALVGRDAEVQALIDRYGRAKDGAGQAILIGGEPGIGKSRLARELGERIADEQHTWLECRCTPDTKNTAFYPIVDLLDRLLDPARETKPETKVEKLEALLSLYGFELNEAMPLFGPLLSFTLPKQFRPLDVSPVKQREMTRNAVLSLLFEMAEREPVVLVIEDLHWADPSTLELLGHFVGDVPSARLLAIFTARPEFAPPWPATAVHAMQLGRLAHADIEQMSRKITGGRALPAELVAQVAARTDGVPLFVEELVRSMIESGALVEQGDRYTLSAPLSETAIPVSLRDSLVARLDRLGRAKETAQVGSAIGREFTFELLRAVSPLDEAVLQEDLDKLVAAELVYRKRRLKNPAYLFKHALIRDAAYDSMLKRSRQQVHARIASTLEEKFPAIVSERPELLAHHHASAEQKLEAIAYGQKAAMAALMRSANAEAIGHCRQTIAWFDAIADARTRAGTELALNMIITSALMATVGWMAPELKATADRSHELLDLGADGPQIVGTLWVLSLYYHLGAKNRPKVRELLGRMVDVARRAGDRGLEAVAHPVLGHCAMLEGELLEARTVLERVFDLYDPVAHRGHCYIYGQDTRVGAGVAIAPALYYLGFPEQALARASAALEWARELNHATSIGLSLFYLMLVHYERGDRGEVLRLCDSHEELANRYGLVEQVSYTGIYRGWARRDLASIEHAVGMREAFGTKMDSSIYHGMIAEIEADLGRVDEALARLDRALVLASELEEPVYLPKLLHRKGLVLLRRDSGAAAACFREAIEIARRQGARMHELQASTALSRILVGEGRGEEARELLAPVFGWFTEGLDSPQLNDARAVLADLR